MVYFIYNKTENSIKIGNSKNVERRLNTLQTAHGNKLILLGYVDGNRIVEKELHKMFGCFRKGDTEWFNLDKDIDNLMINWINQNNKMIVYVNWIDEQGNDLDYAMNDVNNDENINLELDLKEDKRYKLMVYGKMLI